jgi:hypothetical protein
MCRYHTGPGFFVNTYLVFLTVSASIWVYLLLALAGAQTFACPTKADPQKMCSTLTGAAAQPFLTVKNAGRFAAEVWSTHRQAGNLGQHYGLAMNAWHLPICTKGAMLGRVRCVSWALQHTSGQVQMLYCKKCVRRRSRRPVGGRGGGLGGADRRADHRHLCGGAAAGARLRVCCRHAAVPVPAGWVTSRCRPAVFLMVPSCGWTSYDMRRTDTITDTRTVPCTFALSKPRVHRLVLQHWHRDQITHCHHRLRVRCDKSFVSCVQGPLCSASSAAAPAATTSRRTWCRGAPREQICFQLIITCCAIHEYSAAASVFEHIRPHSAAL